MGSRCTICDHPERAKIELALSRRVSGRQIARKFGVSQAAVSRHKTRHMPPQLMASLLATATPTEIDLEKLKETESEGLLQHLVAQRARLYQRADEAQSLGDLRAANQSEQALTNNLALTAKLLGELVSHSTVTTNTLIISAEYVELRSALVRALLPYPDARRAVSKVLRGIEGSEPHMTGVPLIQQGSANASP